MEEKGRRGEGRGRMDEKKGKDRGKMQRILLYCISSGNS